MSVPTHAPPLLAGHEFGGWNAAGTDILAITALPQEFRTAADTLKAVRRHRDAQVTITDPYGDACSVDLVLVNSRGSVQAALETQDSLRRTRARHVVLLGIAAGIPGLVQLGDVVLPEQIVYYEAQKVIDSLELPAASWKSTDSAIRRWASISAGTNVHTDLVMASGEKVVASETFRQKLAATHRRVGALDMEAYGVACAAERRGVTLSVIKGISDFADADKNDDCQEPAIVAATKVFRDLVAEGAFRAPDEDP